MKILVEVQDLPPGRVFSSTVASYVRSVLKVQALRRELALALLELEQRKSTMDSRASSNALTVEAQNILRELGGGPDGN